VLRAVGLVGTGETGDLSGAMLTGDFRLSDGREDCTAVVEILSESFGFMARDASIFAVVYRVDLML